MKLSFIIPVLNEQDSIRQLCDEIIANTLGSDSQEQRDQSPQLCHASDLEIVFIDDGSRDNTFEVLSSIARQNHFVKIVKFRRNFGKSAALQYGFDLVSGDLVFTMDGDLQDDPAEIGNFIKQINQGYDLVSGWKKNRQDPFHKRLPSKLFNYVTSRVFRLKLRDYNCGFKLYRRSLIKELCLYGEMHRYIPALAQALGYRISEIPICHRARKYGKSKYGIERYLRGFFDLLTVKMVTQYMKSPLYLFGRIGIISSLLGLGVTAYLSCLKFFLGQPLYNRPLLFLGILLILAGLQFISMGLISELLINRTNNNTKSMISIADSLNLDKIK